MRDLSQIEFVELLAVVNSYQQKRVKTTIDLKQFEAAIRANDASVAEFLSRSAPFDEKGATELFGKDTFMAALYNEGRRRFEALPTA